MSFFDAWVEGGEAAIISYGEFWQISHLRKRKDMRNEKKSSERM